ncbi:hypothetical protein N7495_003183 [Penicillium taxi]|uniref:uncharacterized protein n=1 Tax=Penicillium taxi TaxID=168475 RepID=UPI002545543E|nr:uncharacterized protein N7495_003183 [Penicillium taxi]KAJ5902655.1 hypothetical protein N7495_003183 [Penicillium taxi]
MGEDVNRNHQSRALGYIGNNSELAWMHKLDCESLDSVRKRWSENRRSLPPQNSITHLSYFLNEERNLEAEVADPFTLPTRPWGNYLIQTYFQTVDPSFPLLDRDLFASQYEHVFEQNKSRPTKNWLAVLNILFAIGSRYYQLSQPGPNNYTDDHVFFDRATTLSSISGSVKCGHADIQQVQIELLASIYYLASSQINRSWKMVGIAARSAIGLGINQQAIGDNIDPTSKETRCRIWWSIVSLEHQLSVVTGRASCIDYYSSGTAPPSPIAPSSSRDNCHRENMAVTNLVEGAYDGQSLHWTLHGTQLQIQQRLQWFESIKPTKFLWFFHLLDLELITHAVVNNVYNADVYREGWDETAARMAIYKLKFATWLRSLQKPYKFMNAEGALQVTDLSIDQISLALNYLSSQIIINRPYLPHSRVDNAGISHPRSTCHKQGVISCKNAALAILSTMTDKPDLNWLYKVTPWLNILHFMMQAMAVLLVHATVGGFWEKTAVSVNSSGEETANSLDPKVIEVFAGIKKAIQWLAEIANKDISAQRAFSICTKIIHRFDPTNGWGLSDVSSIPQQNVNDETCFNLPSQFPPSPDGRSSLGWGPDREIHEFRAEQEPPLLSLDPVLLATSFHDLSTM